jgi:hypothetical protein
VRRLRRAAAQDRLQPEMDEVRRARELQHREGGRRRRDERGEA